MKKLSDTAQTIQSIAFDLGFDQVGFTTLERLQPADDVLKRWIKEGRHGEMQYLENFDERREAFLKDFPQVKTVIVLGVNYYSMVPGTKGTGSPTGNEPVPFVPGTIQGRIARYAWGKDYHEVIARKHAELALRLKEALSAQAEFKSCVDARPIPERFAAAQVGFGFIGKSTMLLSRKFGPWMFLSEMITDLELEKSDYDAYQPLSSKDGVKPGEGSVEDGNTCGSCTDCQSICPTGALDEDYNLDSRRCISYLTIEHKGSIPRELRPKMKDWIFGCDECLSVCPFTSYQKETNWPEFRPESGVGTGLDMEFLFSLTSNRLYKEALSESPLLRTSRKQMLRNACIVLGNSKSDDALPYLQKALREDSTLVRSHAVWALTEIGSLKASQLMAEHAQKEEAPEVLTELKLAKLSKKL